VATHDYSLANATGAAFRSDLNNALAAIASNNSNATDPATTFAFQWYVDTGDNKLKIRNGANNAYIDVGDVTAANLGLAPLAGATFTGTVNGTSFVGSGNSSIGGRLLINTTTARTDVSTTAQLQLEGTDFGTSTFSIVRNSNDAGRPTFVFGKTRGTSTGAVTAVSNNDSLGVIEFLGSDGTDLNRAAFISAEVDGTPGTNDMPGRLTFSTSQDGTNSPTERLRIDSLGNVGIGTSSPNIIGNDTSHTVLSIIETSGSRRGHLELGDNQNVNNGGIGDINFVGHYQNSGHKSMASVRAVAEGSTSGQRGSRLVFETKANGSSIAERLRIDSSGNVGIGTTSPSQSLHVNDSTVYNGILVNGNGAPSVCFAQDASTTVAWRVGLDGNNGSNFAISEGGNTSKLVIDSSGNVGIGTTSVDSGAKLHVKNNSADQYVRIEHESNDTQLRLQVSSSASRTQISSTFGSTGSYVPLAFLTSDTERMRIDNSGFVGIGESSPSSYDSGARNLVVGSASHTGILIKAGTSHYSNLYFGDGTGNDSFRGSVAYNHSGDSLRLSTAGSERMRILSSGTVLVAQTADSFSSSGHILEENGRAYHIAANTGVLNINRQSSDGTLVIFAQDGATEGTIQVSGSTVSYNGGHLSRWSQRASGAARTEILRGSVLSNLDEMCEWAYEAQDAVLYTDEDELPEGVSVGDVKTPAVAAGTEENEQLNRMKVSDTEGDVNVAGVFQGWDDDDDTYTNDFYCAMTGDFVIRIAQGTTVERGDLLMSAGDGTAKPQDDDIVRSKTIAKVTSTTVSTTYSDGSYCVPCVLMAC